MRTMAKIEAKHRFSNHDAYIKSGAWKCPKSATGAHYWIITHEMMRCKYCPEERRIPQQPKPRKKV